MKNIEFKNDLYDIARYKIFDKNGSEVSLKAIILKDKFYSIFKKEIEDWAICEKSEISLNGDSKDIILSKQITDSISTYITWHEIETEIDEKLEVFITGIQFNYIYTSKNWINNKIIEIESNLYSEDISKMFYVVGLNNNQFGLTSETLEQKECPIELNYGKEFIKTNENIIKLLTETNSGIIVLDGHQGTGKTAYIKYIINQLSKHKDIIYVPRFLLTEMANPDFISFLRDQRESIIILEDADEILLNREDNLNTIIATNILSMTNGLLNDQLKIQIIATFNSERKYIDKKLLKEGKIIEDWTFKLLTPEQANLLASSLGFDGSYDKNISLADVYEDFESKGKKNKKTKIRKTNKKRVGFKDDTE